MNNISIGLRQKLRSSAEALLTKSRQEVKDMSPEEVQELVYELQVHQVELEMQNEQLTGMQVEVQQAFEKYVDLYDFAPIGYLTIDSDNRVIEANLAIADMLGVQRRNLVGSSFTRYVTAQCQDAYYLHSKKVLAAKKKYTCTLDLRHLDREVMNVQMHSMKANAGTTFRMALTDITQLKTLEAKLIRARDQARLANKAKSQFLANMSHEIRTPLNAIIGIGHILGKSLTLTRPQKECFDTMRLSSDSLLKLINELLDITKIESNSIELENIAFDMPQILHAAVTISSVKAKEKGLELKTEIDLQGQPYCYGDPHRLKQVILNLLGNAIKFTHSGTVTLRYSASAADEKLKITLQIIDTGIGIEKAKQEDIFKTFTQADASTTRKFGGSGLGLSICKKLVEHMGGTITVSSILGKGTTFSMNLELPICNDKQEVESFYINDSTKAETINPPSDLSKKILLVEDYPANILIATTILKQLGYEYDVAHNGQEALERLESTHYGIVLMDIQMQGMDGLEATAKLRKIEVEKNSSHTTVIAMTAHAMADDRARCIEAGMDDYISKPFNPEELAKKLEEYFHADAA